MEIQTTIQHGHEAKQTEFCPFQIHQEEAAETYDDLLMILRRIFDRLDLGQAFKNLD